VELCALVAAALRSMRGIAAEGPNEEEYELL
jgi:hypothetical protein